MHKFKHTSLLALSLYLSAFTSFALAEEVGASADDVTLLLNTLNWGGMMASLLVILAATLLLRIVDKLVQNLGDMFAERRLFLQKMNAFLRFGVYIATIVTVVFLSFKLSAQVIAIIAGGTAVAIGFATKDLVASLISGMIIIVDRPFQTGDRVSFEGQYGDIINIGLRSVKLQTLDDNTVTIPNNLFLTSVTSCGNYGVLDMQVVIDFHIGLDQDSQLATELIREAAATSRFVYLPKPIVVLVSQVVLDHCIALRLRLKLYVLDTQYEKSMETDITLRVMSAFARNGIGPPAVLHRNLDNVVVSPQAALESSPRLPM